MTTRLHQRNTSTRILTARIVAAALALLALPAGAATLRAHEKAEKSEQTVIRSRDFTDLVAFLRDALLDQRATKVNLCRLVPQSVPSGSPRLQFQGCP